MKIKLYIVGMAPDQRRHTDLCRADGLYHDGEYFVTVERMYLEAQSDTPAALRMLAMSALQKSVAARYEYLAVLFPRRTECSWMLPGVETIHYISRKTGDIVDTSMLAFLQNIHVGLDAIADRAARRRTWALSKDAFAISEVTQEEIAERMSRSAIMAPVTNAGLDIPPLEDGACPERN